MWRAFLVVFLCSLCAGYDPLTGTFDATFASIMISAECGPGTGGPNGFCGDGTTCQTTVASVQSANIHSSAYESVNVPLIQYGTNDTCCTLTISWYPSAEDSISIVIENDGSCTYMSGTYGPAVISSLPVVAHRSGTSNPITVVVYEITDCPSDSTWCGTSCCSQGTICTNPNLGQCCAIQEYQCKL